MDRIADRPKLAVWKFTSCDGCQLSILDLEEELLSLPDVVEISHFLEATRAVLEGPYDVSIVEGSVTTPEEVERIHEIRRLSGKLITIGACANAGGIQALRNFASIDGFVDVVYATPSYISTLSNSTPIGEHVDVDFELQGCPPDPGQVLELITALIAGRRPAISSQSVCVECKIRGNVCVMVARGEPCLGPVTHAGCGAICPAYDRGCYGCFGPKETPNTASLTAWLERSGTPRRDLLDRYRHVNALAPPFAAEADELQGEASEEAGRG